MEDSNVEVNGSGVVYEYESRSDIKDEENSMKDNILYESERDIEDVDDIVIGFGVEYVYSSDIEIVERENRP
jgi:hypothetical protein